MKKNISVFAGENGAGKSNFFEGLLHIMMNIISPEKIQFPI